MRPLGQDELTARRARLTPANLDRADEVIE
jgi:hypothetical protein